MKKAWPYLLLIILFAIAIRFPTFMTDFVNIDENEYSIAAQKILAGGLPYKDVLIYQPPVIYYIYTLGFWLTGGTHIWSAQMITLGFVAGTILALYALGKALTGSKRTGLAAALAYAAFSVTFLPQDMLAANCEILMMLPLTCSALTLFYADKKGSLGLYLLTGILASLGFLSKYQGGVVVAAEGFYILVLSAIALRSFSIKKNVIPSVMLTIGFFIPIGLIALYLWRGNAGQQAIEALSYIFLYAKGPVQSDRLYVLIKFLARSALFILPALIMWWGAFAVIGRYLKKLHKADTFAEQPYMVFMLLWFFISILPIIVGGRIYFHYYFVILPPTAILFGMWWNDRGYQMKKWAKVLAIVWSIICVGGWTIYASTKPYRPLGRKDQWVHAARYMNSISKPDETLFIWGYCPQIYIQSGLPNATRFTTTDYLTGRSPMTAGLEFDPKSPNPPSTWDKFLNDFIDPAGIVIFDTSNNIFPKAWEYLEEDFTRALPTYIIDTVPSNYRRYGRYPIDMFPYLAETLKDNYEKIHSVKGFDIYRIK